MLLKGRATCFNVFLLFPQNQVDIVEKFTSNPYLIVKEPHVSDYYSTLFQKSKKSARHRSRLVVGGKSTKRLALAMSALHDTT
jgi:hypothetical protein